jgi:hypothetical protein
VHPIPVRLSAVEDVVAVVRLPGDDGSLFRARVEQLRSDYSAALRRPVAAAADWLPEIGAGVVTLQTGQDGESPATSGRDLLVWGSPVCGNGVPDEAALRSAVDAPSANARGVSGVWVVVHITSDRVRLLTSPTLVHTLKRVDGPDGTAIATRGLAAHVLAGVTPRLSEAAIPEYVLLDYVLGQEELLADTLVLGDAQVIDVRRTDLVATSWWLPAERFAPGPPSDAGVLRDVVGDSMRAAIAPADTKLGLTAGRDSTLLASVIAGRGARVDTFTLGPRWLDDARGARAVSRRLGWGHVNGVQAFGPRSWSRIAELSRWSEGLTTGDQVVDTTLNLKDASITWLSGSGGEIGRGFYWARYGTADRWLDWARSELIGPLEGAGKTMGERLDAQLDVIRSYGRGPEDTLDLLYATGRMARWLGRLMPTSPLRNFHAGYLDPPVVSALLDIPVADRLSHRTFDEALSVDTPNLYDVAQAATSPRAFRAWDAARFRRIDVNHTRSLLELVAGIDSDSPVRGAMGERWWRTTVDAARVPSEGWARRQLWNAVAVEGLARAI